MLKQTTENLLRRLQYDLQEVCALRGRPCWIYFEYKHYILSLGIAKLESMKKADAGNSLESISKMLAEYRKAYYTIFNQ